MAVLAVPIADEWWSTRWRECGRVGVSREVWQFLCSARQDGVNFSRTIQIGRQDVLASHSDIARVAEGSGISVVDPVGSYAEDLFHLLGADEVDSLDASDFEGATIIHDLNEPIPEQVKGCYTAVFDGGSLEHVFDVRRAFANVMELVAPGGHLIMVNPADRCMGHGFYQFSPDLYRRVLSEDNGFSIRRILLSDKGIRQRWYELAPPGDGHQPMFRSKGATYACVLAQRISNTDPLRVAPQQSHYVRVWESTPVRRTVARRLFYAMPSSVRRLAYAARTEIGRRSRAYHETFRRVDMPS